MIQFNNRERWTLFLKLLPCLALGGWFLTSAGWSAWLAIATTVIALVGVVYLCEVKGLAPTIRMVSAAILCALPGIALISLSLNAGVCKLLVLLVAMGSYATVVVLAKNGAFPRRLMTAGCWSILFIAGAVAFAVASRLWPVAMSLACDTLDVIRILLSGNWTV